MALDQTLLDELAEKIAASLRAAGHFKQEITGEIKAALAGVFEGLDVVTSERMEVAEALLARVQEQIKELEGRVAELEARLKDTRERRPRGSPEN